MKNPPAWVRVWEPRWGRGEAGVAIPEGAVRVGLSAFLASGAGFFTRGHFENNRRLSEGDLGGRTVSSPEEGW